MTHRHLPTRVAPSLLPAADLARLADEVARVSGVVDMLHIDVMDGHFVPNLTVGPPVVKALRTYSALYFDCHLMMTNPGEYLEAFREAGADGCSVHVEVGNTLEHLAHMADLGLDRGLAVNPDTPYEAIEDFLEYVDMVTVMTVVPGFGGQAFMKEVLPKMRRIRDQIQLRGLPVAIEVDGGISLETAPLAAEAGADTFVAGNAVFGAPEPAEAAAALRDALRLLRR